MAIKSREHFVGAWAFLIGVILSIIIGMSTASFLSLENIRSYNPIIYGILVVLGVIIGFSIRVSGKDSEAFLIAGTIIVIVSRFGMEGVSNSLIGIGISDTVSSIFGALLALLVPAVIIVALKRVFSLANI